MSRLLSLLPPIIQNQLQVKISSTNLVILILIWYFLINSLPLTQEKMVQGHYHMLRANFH